MLSTVLGWLKAQKETDLKILLTKHASSEEGMLILQNWQNFMVHQVALYLCSMPKDLLLCGPWGPLCHHLEWVPQGCGSSGM